MKVKLGLASVLGTAVLAASANAAVLDQFNFQNNTGGETTVAPASSDPATTASDISRGAGFVPDSSNFSKNGFGDYPVTNAYKTDAVAAETAGDYDTFSLAPTAGNALSLSNIVFAFFSQNGTDPTYGNPAFNATLEYSLDGNTFTAAASQVNSSDSGFPGHPVIATVDLSGVSELQSVLTPIYFRIDIYNVGGYQPSGIGESSNGSQDLTISGTASPATVPEPASLALAGLGAGAMLLRRRRARA